MELFSEKFCIFIILSFCAHYAHLLDNFAGPYDILLKGITTCKNYKSEKHAIIFKGRINSEGNNKYSLSGNFTIKRNLTKKAMMILDVGKYSNQGLKPHFFTFDMPLCDMLNQHFKSTWKVMRKQSGIDCPFPLGNYTLTKVPANFKFGVGVAVYGSYKADVKIEENGETILCWETLIDIIPQ